VSGLPLAGALLILLLGSGTAAAQRVIVRPLIGGLPADSGFAGGVELERFRAAGPFDARLRAVASVKRYYFLQLTMDAPQIGPSWLFVAGGARYRNYPEEDFWGLGPDTPRDGRQNFLMEDVDLFGEAGVHAGIARIALTAGYRRANVGPGRDRDYPSVTEELQTQPRFPYAGASVVLDSRDNESDPRAGGQVALEWTAFESAFHRYVLDLRKYSNLRPAGRLAFRALLTFTAASAEDGAPFFMLPYAGGPGTVRGFSPYRFRDRNAMILNAEYRKELLSFLDALAFVDAGRVFAEAGNLGFDNLHASGGFGTRVKFGTRIFFGVDVGISREGTHLWFRTGHMF
jgi:hypothetical protein